MNLAYNTISKSLSVLFLLCIIPSIYSRPFLDDVWGAVEYVLNGGSLTSIEKIPMNEELKQTGLNFIENKTVFYTKQVKQELKTEYTDIFNPMIIKEILKIIPETYSNEFFKDYKPLISQIKKRPGIHRLENETTEELYAKYENDINNFIPEFKELIRNKFYYDDTSFDFTYDLGMGMVGNKLLGKIPGVVKSIMLDEVGYFSGNNTEDFLQTAESELKSCGENKVNMDKTKVYSNKIEYVPWDIRVNVMFNSVIYKDDFDFTKANYNQEFSLVSQNGDYYCKTKVDSSLFNKKENKLTIMFPHNCIQPNQQSLSFTLTMNTKRKMKMITFIRTYTFTDVNVTILDDRHILNNNILSNVYYDNEKNSFFAFSLLTLNQEYQSGDTIIEYSFNKKQYQRELLTSTNNYSLSLIKEQDSLIDFILYTKENKILFAVENCLLKSLGNMVEMFVEKNAYYGYNENFYMKLLFNVDVTNEHVDFYYNNEYIGKKIIGMDNIEIKLPKVDSNVISKITYKIGDVTYPGFSIYQGLIGGVDGQEIEKFLSEYFINTIKTYGLKLNEKQLNVIETYINEFRNQLNIISDSLCSQLEMINEFKEILSDVFSTIQDKCNNDETIEAFVTEILGDYSSINSGINKVIPGMNRNDIIQDTKEILGQVLVTKVSNEMLDVLAVQVSQGLFMYSDYESANILASKIKNKIIEIIKSECNNISTNHNIQQINDNAFIEIKQKQIVSWSPSNITIIFKEEQISFYKEETITIGLVRKNGVKMIWESSLTYPSALSEQTFTIPANTFKYIENEILPESNIYILAYKIDTNIITIPNASIEVVKHITCPNPFKNALTSSITYIYDSFELYDSTYEAIIIENENTLLTLPQYGKVYSVIIPTETNILYANEEVIFIESITAVPDTYIYLSNSKTPIHITLKSNAYPISVSISTERDMIGVYQLENKSTVISVDINEIILPSDKKLDFYLEYKRYKMKAFTIYISNYLSDINNKDITIPIFDTLYEWLPPCAQYSVKYSQIELFTQLQLTNLDTNISAFTSDYEVAIDEDNYEILIQNSLTDKFLEIHNDQSWKYKTYGKTYTALEILLDKMISLISFETINNTLITNVNDLITNNEIISNSISTFIETISQQLQNIVDTTNEDKYKSITKQIITEMTYIYTYKLLFTNIQAQYLNKLRSFTNTYITSFYNNNIITNKRFPININNPDIQTDKLDIIELNKVINLTLPYEYIANIERDEIYEFMLININSDKEACTVKADTSYLHSIILSFPSSCAAYNTNSEKNKYILGYRMNSTWLEHTIYNLYKFTNIIIESVDYKALPKADSSVFLNYELFPLNKYHFIQEPKQNPNTTDIFIQYRQSNKAFTSVPPSTVKSSLDFIVYNTTSKRILHADKGIVIISHKMRAINSKLLLKNAQNKVMSFGLVFDSNITDSKIINGIYQNREKLPCKQVNDTVITCNITSSTNKDFNLRGNNTSNNIFTNNITLSVIDEEDIWDNNQIQSCQYGLFAKDIKLNNNKPDLIKSLKASLISTDPPKSIDLLKTNHIITFPQIETYGRYNLILYDIDPDFPLISSPIIFATPHFDIVNKHIQLELPQSEEFAISINGVTCKQEEFKLKDKTSDQTDDIQCSSEINPQTSLYTCNINTKLNINNYELISGEHILDTLYVTIPFKNANFALTSIPLCVVALQGELNIFGITSSDYPVKFVDEVEFISVKQNTITKSSLELIENDSLLSTSVAFENDDEYYITMKYNGAVIELKDIVIKPSLDFFSFNEDNYIIINDSNKQPTSFDLYINLLFDYGDRKEIDFNIKDHSTVSCIIE